MSGNFYNLIMATVPEFYSGNEGEFTIPQDRFLQYTEDHIKKEFESLDQDVIAKLESLPTIFATEDEVVDARIGKITDITVSSHAVKAKYKFDEDRYPLTSGVLQENWQKLGISESNFEFHRGHWGVKECDLDDFYEEYLKSLTGIAHQLKNADKKVQLIYAFNGTGKTRLSRAMKNIVASKNDGRDEEEKSRNKFLYYSAFTEDLFYWDNDLEADSEPKLRIQPNTFTDWLLKDQGLDRDIIDIFQKFTGSKTEPLFNIEENTVTFSNPNSFPLRFPIEFGGRSDSFKISKGEESNFIWSVFYALLKQVISIRDDKTDDSSDCDQLQYVFIDDPISSLDDNHLIELAVSLASTIRNSRYENNQGLRFIITTHNPLFYNVLHNELNNDLTGKKSDGSTGKVYKKKQSAKYILKEHVDGTFQLEDSNDRPFSYHLFLLSELRKLQSIEQVEKYHFNLLRNILEKTATFLGYKQWNELLQKLPEDDRGVMNRMLNLYSHSAHAGEEISELTDINKEKFIKIIKDFAEKYNFANLKEDESARTN